MQFLRQYHDAEWELLSVYELWEYQRMLVNITFGRADTFLVWG
jgi:hypothetical protein